MQIICPQCNKKFEIKSQLIPANGRLLQCGNCNHKWFYKKKIIKEYKTESAVSEKTFTNHTSKTNDNNIEEVDIAKPSKQDRNKSIEKNKKNYFKIFLVTLISIISLILIIDTFQSQISYFYPNIENILTNLYETLKDISLFFKDLIK